MICQHEKRKIVLKANGYEIYQCCFCSLIFVKGERLGFEENYKNYYQKETGGRFRPVIEFIVKIFRFYRAWKISRLKTDAKNILDIGSGRGWTLYFLKKYFKYKSVIGTQISENAYRFSTDKLGLEIYNSDLLSLNFKNNFDIITLWHVLEHISEPEAYIEKIHKLLNRDGFLIIEVPNYNSWTRKLTKTHWIALDLKNHLNFFTPRSLSRMLYKYNFKIKKNNMFSLEYSTFTSVQSIVNLVTGSQNYFFEYLQGGKLNFKIIYHTILFIFLFPFCLLINLWLYFSRSGEVINIIAEKNE